MKLIRCPKCGDVNGLSYRWKNCDCELTGGAYEPDGQHAIVAGPCDLYGLSNSLFFPHLEAARLRQGKEMAWRYDETNGRITRLADNPGAFPDHERMA